MIPFLEGFYTLANLHHGSRQFMPQHHGRMNFRRSLIPVINMHVRSADAAGADLYQDVILPDLRHGFFPQPKLPIAQEIIRFHGQPSDMCLFFLLVSI